MNARLERDADNFDCDLYRLICRAEQHADESTPANRAKWSIAIKHLKNARMPVRTMMSEKDREKTA
jgi:hypothetical protein